MQAPSLRSDGRGAAAWEVPRRRKPNRDRRIVVSVRCCTRLIREGCSADSLGALAASRQDVALLDPGAKWQDRRAASRYVRRAAVHVVRGGRQALPFEGI